MPRSLAAFALIMALTSCSDATGPDSVAGVYALVSVDGKPLPYTAMQDASTKVEELSGTIIFGADGHFQESATTRFTLDGRASTSTSSSTGTFAISGQAITMLYSSGGTISGSWDGSSTITLTRTGTLWAFRK
jgi:hypothetical protein